MRCHAIPRRNLGVLGLVFLHHQRPTVYGLNSMRCHDVPSFSRKSSSDISTFLIRKYSLSLQIQPIVTIHFQMHLLLFQVMYLPFSSKMPKFPSMRRECISFTPSLGLEDENFDNMHIQCERDTPTKPISYAKFKKKKMSLYWEIRLQSRWSQLKILFNDFMFKCGDSTCSIWQFAQAFWNYVCMNGMSGNNYTLIESSSN